MYCQSISISAVQHAGGMIDDEKDKGKARNYAKEIWHVAATRPHVLPLRGTLAYPTCSICAESDSTTQTSFKPRNLHAMSTAVALQASGLKDREAYRHQIEVSPHLAFDGLTCTAGDSPTIAS